MSYEIKGDVDVKRQLRAMGGKQANLFLVDGEVDFTTAEPAHGYNQLYVNTVGGNGSVSTTETFGAGRLYRSAGNTWFEILPEIGYLIDNGAVLKRYDGASWVEVGTPGITDWFTTLSYAVGDYVNESNKLYKCLVAHTAGDFAVDLAAGNWVEVSRAFDDWEFAANNDTAQVLSSYILTPGNTINMPAAPANGDAVRFATLTEWSAANITFTAPGATTVAAGQVGVLAGYDVVEFVYDSGNDNWVALLGGSAAPDIAVPIDSSAGVLALSLDAATGSGSIKRWVNKDVTNTASIAPQSGEELNGVVDATFLFSNYATGTYFEAVDYAVGKWSIQVVGVATAINLAYAHFGSRTARETTGDQLNYLTADIISVDTAGVVIADGTFTAPSDGLYSVDINLDAGNNTTSGNNSHFTSFMYQVNGGTAQRLSNVQYTAEMNDYIDRQNYTAKALIQLSAGDTVRFAVGDDAAANATLIQDLFNYDVVVAQLPSQEVVLAGMVTPTSLEYFSQALTADHGGTSGEEDLGVSYTIVNSGRYLVTVYGRVLVNGDDVLTYVKATNASNVAYEGLEYRVSSQDGSRASAYNEEHRGSATAILDLVAGDIIKLRGDETGNGDILRDTRLTVQQLPSAQVVMPDALPVEDLAFAKISLSTNPVLLTGGQILGFDVVEFDNAGAANVPTGELIIPTTGTYELSSQCRFAPAQQAVDYSLIIRVNGSVVAKNGGVENSTVATDRVVYNVSTGPLQLTAGDVVSVILLNGSTGNITISEGTDSNWLSMKQLATKTVINTTDIPADNTGVADGDTLIWNATNGQYEPGAASGGSGGVTAWAATTAVVTGELRSVGLGGTTVTLKSNSDRTTGATFDATEAAEWTLVSQESIESYVASSLYVANMMISHEGSLWSRASTGVSGVAFNSFEAADWSQVVYNRVPTWVADTYYLTGQLVRTTVAGVIDVVLIRDSVGLSQATFNPTEALFWRVVNQQDIPAFAASTGYPKGFLVTDGGQTYRRVTSGQSGASIAADGAAWESWITGATVLDQSASGYFDIGNMRIQWGRVPTGAGSVAVTFPAPFANTSYSVTANVVQGGTFHAHVVMFGGFLTTGVTMNRKLVNDTTYGDSPNEIMWQAIGLRP